jgi:hypothetical protein
MTRIASALVLVALVLLLLVVTEPTGWNAILFSFVGAPLLGAGILAAILGIRKNARE